MPLPCSADDFFYIAVYGHPSEFFADTLGGGNEYGRVSRTTRSFFNDKVCLGDFLRTVDDLAHAETVFAAEVIDPTCTARKEMLECQNVRFCQIAYVDIVSDTRAVLGRIVCPIDRYLVTDALCRF